MLSLELLEAAEPLTRHASTSASLRLVPPYFSWIDGAPLRRWSEVQTLPGALLFFCRIRKDPFTSRTLHRVEAARVSEKKGPLESLVAVSAASGATPPASVLFAAESWSRAQDLSMIPRC